MRMLSSKVIADFISAKKFDERIILERDSSFPKISIVTPSYNQAEFLEKTILSVLNQNYPNLEFIIIDGGSCDESVNIIKKYNKYISYWISEKDNGQANAINKGIEIASGEIIGWQNSDDIYLPGVFNMVGRKFSKAPNIDLIFGNRIDIDEYDTVIRDVRYVPFNYKSLIYEGAALNNATTFWRKKSMEKVGLFNEDLKFCMDYDFWVRAGKEFKFLFIREYLGCFRHHKKSKTSTIIKVSHVERKQILKEEGIKQNTFLQYCAKGRRIFLYIWQGDVLYIIRGIYNRASKIFGKGK